MTVFFLNYKKIVGPEVTFDACVLDFEAAVWQSLRNAFPDIQLHGCLFHFNQAIHRKVQELGLQAEYRKNGAVAELIKQLYSLPFLPPRLMGTEFSNLKSKALLFDDARLSKVFAYAEKTWMKSTVWKLKNISAYQRLIRTNNDTEGYHYRLNKKCGDHPPFYKLVGILHSEA